MPSRFVLKTALQQEIVRELESIRDSARQEGERMLEDARSQRERMLKEAERKVERELEVRRQRGLSKTRLEGRNSLLGVRRREVDRVFEEVRQTLSALAEEEPERYGKILFALFKAGRAALPEGPLKVHAGEAEAELLSPQLKGEKITVAVEKGMAGMILETADGRVRCDHTLETLLARVRSEREAELERILFGEDHEQSPG